MHCKQPKMGGLTLTLLSAAAWAGGNVIARARPQVNMAAFVI